jgi:hypothetical protein
MMTQADAFARSSASLGAGQLYLAGVVVGVGWAIQFRRHHSLMPLA